MVVIIVDNFILFQTLGENDSKFTFEYDVNYKSVVDTLYWVKYSYLILVC